MSMTPLGPCELHEVSNCTYCSGRDKAFEASILQPAPDPNGKQQHRRDCAVFNLESCDCNHADTPSLPVIPGGPTIRARFAGNCKSCGRRYQVNEGIHHDRDADGWIGVECCA